MAEKHTVLLAEDHPIVRAGLRTLLSAQDDMEIVGEASNGRDAISLAGRLMPNLVMMDLHMPDTNGIEAITEIHQRNPDIRILVLTFQKSDDYVHAAMRAGAHGYVLKDDPTAEILTAIRKVIAGKAYLSESIVDNMARLFSEHGRKANVSSLLDMLTVREREVLKLSAEGHPSKYIGIRIARSPKTVDKHRANLMRKLNIHNVASLTQFAVEHGLTALG